MSLGKRIGIVAGALGALLVVGAVGFYILLDRTMLRASTSTPSSPGWRDTLGAMGHLPDLTGLVLERMVDGDGSVMLYDSTRWLPASSDVGALLAKLIGPDSGAALSSADTAQWREVASDTALDRFVGLARLRSWAAVSHALPDSTDIEMGRLPRYRAALVPMDRLILRALWRAAHRDVPGAKTDLAAVTSIGEQMFRREPFDLGLMQGVGILGRAFRAYDKMAALTRDSALAHRIQPLSAWLQLKPGRVWQRIPSDSCAAVVADASLPLGYRGLALEKMGGSIVRARWLVFGASNADLAIFAPFLQDRDPDIARYAAAVQRQFSRKGIRARQRMPGF